jgi:hypothetical protein
MEPEKAYEHLVKIAEQLNISVRCDDLRQSGFAVRSGLCKIRGERVFIMDTAKNTAEKVRLLADCLSQMNLEGIYVLPAVRILLDSASRSQGRFAF